jgi:hypothetical protein
MNVFSTPQRTPLANERSRPPCIPGRGGLKFAVGSALRAGWQLRLQGCQMRNAPLPYEAPGSADCALGMIEHRVHTRAEVDIFDEDTTLKDCCRDNPAIQVAATAAYRSTTAPRAPRISTLDCRTTHVAMPRSQTLSEAWRYRAVRCSSTETAPMWQNGSSALRMNFVPGCPTECQRCASATSPGCFAHLHSKPWLAIIMPSMGQHPQVTAHECADRERRPRANRASWRRIVTFGTCYGRRCQPIRIKGLATRYRHCSSDRQMHASEFMNADRTSCDLW